MRSAQVCSNENWPQQLAFDFLAGIRTRELDVANATASEHCASEPDAVEVQSQRPCFNGVSQDATTREDASLADPGNTNGDTLLGVKSGLKRPIYAASGDREFLVSLSNQCFS